MGLSHHPDEGYSTDHTSESSTERSIAEAGIPQPLRDLGSLPYRLRKKDTLCKKTADSTSEASYKSTDSPAAKASLDSEVLPTTILPQIGTARSLQHGQENHDPSPFPVTASSVAHSPEPTSPDLGLKHRSLTSAAHLPPVKLPQHFFPDTSRSASNPGHSAERATLDGTATNNPSLIHSPTRQEASLPSAGHGSPEQNNYVPQEPPAYQPRPLNIPKRPQSRLHRLRSPHNIERGFYHIFHSIRLVFLDVLFLFFFLALTGIILLWGQLWRMNDRLFPMTYDQVSGTWYGPLEYSYPQHDFILGITTTGIMIPLIPLAVIILLQFWIRSWLDFQAAIFALKKAMVMMLFLQVILKSYIGEFRPFFISLCNPDPVQLNALRLKIPPDQYNSNSPRVFADPTVCRPNPAKTAPQNHKDLMFAMTSFPSGHTSEAFMAGTFLALYLNAKLKPFGDFHTSFWKMVAVMAPVIGAIFIAGSLVADRNHHYHDIVLSIPMGMIVALFAYRTHYASIFDYRTNHLPLPWSGSHESLHPTVPEPRAGNGHTQTNKGTNNFTATAWPRKSKTYSYGNNGQQRGRTSGVPGLDGTADGAISPINVVGEGDTARRRYGVLRRAKGRTRLAIFPRTEFTRGSSQRVSGVVQPDGRGWFEMRGAVGTDGSVSARADGRMGVDEWVRQARRGRGGRPSEMV